MSDYVSELRRDLVEAAERQAHRGRAGRASRPLHPRAWSPTALAGAVAVAVAVVAVVVTLTTLAPPPKPSDAKIVTTVHLGGQPRAAVLAGGSLWIADFEGRVLRLDPATHRVRARIPISGTPTSITAARGAVWVMSQDPDRGGPTRSHLYKLDARTGRRLDRIAVNGWGGAIAFGAGGLWLPTNAHGGDVERIDPDSFQRTAFFPFETGRGLAVAGNTVWTLQNRSVLQIDPVTARVSRIGGIMLAGDGDGAVLADRDGVWITGPGDGRLWRVEGGRVTRRIAVGDQAGVIAATGSAIWVSAWSASRTLQDGNEVVRVDPEDGKVVQRVDFGYRVPKALVPVGKDLWVITSGGEAMLVSPE
jgi:hypothetical protein